jgi:hypothetical protein
VVPKERTGSLFVRKIVSASSSRKLVSVCNQDSECVSGTHTFSFRDLLAVAQIFTPFFSFFHFSFLKLLEKG